VAVQRLESEAALIEKGSGSLSAAPPFFIGGQSAIFSLD
jgi:hypothetical protein